MAIVMRSGGSHRLGNRIGAGHQQRGFFAAHQLRICGIEPVDGRLELGGQAKIIDWRDERHQVRRKERGQNFRHIVPLDAHAARLPAGVAPTAAADVQKRTVKPRNAVPPQPRPRR